MATKKPKTQQGRRLTALALVACIGLGIAALAGATFAAMSMFHKPNVQIAAVLPAKAPSANHAHAGGPPPAQPAPPSPTEHAAKEDSPHPAIPVKPASVRMSPGQWEALDTLLVQQFKRCWTDKPNKASKQYVPKVEVMFQPDGSLQGKPALINVPGDSASKALAASAIKAVTRCQPLNIPSTFGPFYDEWKIRIIHFDPSIFQSADASR